MQQLRAEDALRVRVEPGDQDAKSDQDDGKTHKERRPGRAVRAGRAESIDDRQVLYGPQNPQREGAAERSELSPHPRVGKASPADLLEKTGDQARGNAKDQELGRIRRGDGHRKKRLD